MSVSSPRIRSGVWANARLDSWLPEAAAQPAAQQPGQKPAKIRSIFGSDQIEEMSLDEVILAYIQDEPDG
mgnify:CR=1 FL=1